MCFINLLPAFAIACCLGAETMAQDVPPQYTPDLAEWSTFYNKVEQAPKAIDHSPDGVLWLPPSAWVPWDGTVIDPDSMSTKTLVETICPANGNTILGLRELFYEHNPFADVKNPTKAEVDEWHRLSLNHLRRLVGISTPIEPDHCLYARALWAQERKYTRMWDADYPEGTCDGYTTGHCGASFLPLPEDQVPYLPPGHPPCRRLAGSEGVVSSPKSNIPWSIKWVRAFCSILEREGFDGGHTGPFFKRTKFGFSFWDFNHGNFHSNAILRAKWA